MSHSSRCRDCSNLREEYTFIGSAITKMKLVSVLYCFFPYLRFRVIGAPKPTGSGSGWDEEN
jgi:hypothetical protein